MKKKKKGTVRYTDREIEAMRRQGKDRTDPARLDVMTEAGLTAAAEHEGAFDWANAEIGIPAPKQQLTVRFDSDIVDWFKAQGSGYQTRMNAVLRRFMEAQKSHRR
jgi:uncharacterized protein (DUF4415 family)